MGARIRARRTDLGLTQTALAAAAGISAPYLNLIEHERRRIGGRLLLALARALEVEPSVLAEGPEAGMVAGLAAAAADDPAAERPRAGELGARFPGWAGLILRQHQRIRRLEEAVETLSDRLTNDPRLAAALHEVLSTVTAIRATAAILNEPGDLDPDWRGRFHRNLDEDGGRLAISARALVAYLDGESGVAVEAATVSAQEAFEAWLAARDAQAEAALAEPGGGTAHEGGAADVAAGDLPESAEARALALAFLDEARADAAAMPLAGVRAALAGGADPLDVALRFGVPLGQAFRRLAGVPGAGFGLVTCDAAGAITFRRPAAGFQLPRLGAACPLWPLYQALSRPMQPVAALIEQSARNARRFRVWALAEPLPGGDPRLPPVFVAAMLMRAAREDDSGPAAPVGVTCRVCPRDPCIARREPSVLPR